jgi:pimeloyl-ACP methyl ester carboxylesterase
VTRSGAVSGAVQHATEQRGEVAGLEVFWRRAPDAERPALYVHGSPTNSDDFLPFLERTGGVAPDLPGFGRSAKPAAFDYSVPGYARFLAALIEHLGLERLALVVHDWGVVALTLPPELLRRVERLVVMNAVPLWSEYRWHRIGRLWRAPVVGELAMGFSTRWGLKRFSRGALAAAGPAPDQLIDRVWDHFDHGTQRAILKLYRSGDPDALGRAGGRLGETDCPALVVWGERDPYIPTSCADRYADALGPASRLELLPDAGHWPWLDRPDVIDMVADFVEAA